MPPAVIEDMNRHGRRRRVGQEFDERAGFNVPCNGIARDLDDPEALQCRRKERIGATDRQPAWQCDGFDLALDDEFQRHGRTERGRMIPDHLMTIERIPALGPSMAFQVGGRGHRGFVQQGDLAADQFIVGLPRPDHAIDAFTQEIDEVIGLAQIQIDLRIALVKIRQGGKDDPSCLTAQKVYTQKPFRLGAAQGAFGVLDIIEDAEAAAIIGFPVGRGAHLSRCPVQKPDTQAPLDLLDGIRGGRRRQAQILSRSGEALSLHDAGEDAHGVQSIHNPKIPNGDCGLYGIICTVEGASFRPMPIRSRRSNMTDTHPKIALVTGASRGLGRNTAISLARRGVDVIGTYNSKSGEAEETARAIRDLGRRAVMLQLDTGKTSSFPDFVVAVQSALQQEWQRDTFDFLINNAGIGINAPFAETTEDQFDLLMNIHLKGVFFLTQKLLPVIADGGRIVNLSSGLARFALPGYAAYAAMKGAIEVLTRYQAKELGARGIAVNTIAPGAIETDFGGGTVRDNAEVNAFIAGTIALGRVGRPDDIGPAIASLLSDDNRWVNAQRIEVSGGMLL